MSHLTMATPWNQAIRRRLKSEVRSHTSLQQPNQRRPSIELFSSGLNMRQEYNLQLLGQVWQASSERRAPRGPLRRAQWLSRIGRVPLDVHITSRQQGPSKGKRPLDLNNLPWHKHTSGHPERSRQSKLVFERPHEGWHSEGSRGHHRTLSREGHSDCVNTIVLYDQFTGMPIVYQPVDERADLRRAHLGGSRGEAPEPLGGGSQRHRKWIEQPRHHH